MDFRPYNEPLGPNNPLWARESNNVEYAQTYTPHRDRSFSLRDMLYNTDYDLLARARGYDVGLNMLEHMARLFGHEKPPSFAGEDEAAIRGQASKATRLFEPSPRSENEKQREEFLKRFIQGDKADPLWRALGYPAAVADVGVGLFESLSKDDGAVDFGPHGEIEIPATPDDARKNWKDWQKLNAIESMMDQEYRAENPRSKRRSRPSRPFWPDRK